MTAKIETQLIHGGIDGDERTGAVSVPIYQTSTYKQAAFGPPPLYEYSRTGNPTREALEKLIAQLEEGEAGFAFASGMAAIAAVLLLFKSGDEVVISNNVYGGTFRVLDKVFKQFGLTYQIVDTSRLELLEKALNEKPAAVLLESPANPLLTITDITAVASLARSRGVLTIVDNTFMTPYLQKPLALGADIVVHSATKYLGGHSDLVAGLAVAGTAELAERLHFLQNATGGILGPFDSWLLLRGIKTLGVRMDRHVENTRFIAEYLSSHSGVEGLYYPGLETSEGYEVHRRQALAPGGMVSFLLSEQYDLQRFFRSLQVITFAESLGGVESLISHPASMTHASIPEEIRRKVGIAENLVRLSVGLENKEDLVRDLDRALQEARR